MGGPNNYETKKIIIIIPFQLYKSQLHLRIIYDMKLFDLNILNLWLLRPTVELVKNRISFTGSGTLNRLNKVENFLIR